MFEIVEKKKILVLNAIVTGVVMSEYRQQQISHANTENTAPASKLAPESLTRHKYFNINILNVFQGEILL